MTLSVDILRQIIRSFELRKYGEEEVELLACLDSEGNTRASFYVDEAMKREMATVLLGGVPKQHFENTAAGECPVCGRHHSGPCVTVGYEDPQPAICTRELGHAGPCNGFPRVSCYNKESNLNEKKMKTKAGVTRSKKLRLSLVPASLLRFCARRLEFGIERGHEEGNWKLGAGDESSRAAALDHLFHHLLAYKEDGGTDQLEAIAANVAFLTYYEEKKPFAPNGPVSEER